MVATLVSKTSALLRESSILSTATARKVNRYGTEPGLNPVRALDWAWRSIRQPSFL